MPKDLSQGNLCLAPNTQGPLDISLALGLGALGASASVAQVLFLREFMVLFYGNELSTALILGSWLLLTSVGSFLTRTFAHKFIKKRLVFAFGLCLLGYALFLSLLIIRSFKEIWGIPVGIMPGMDVMVFSLFLGMGPFCLLSGSLFVLGCDALSHSTRKHIHALSDVYWLEALGATGGGMGLALAFTCFFSHIQIAWVCLFLTTLSSFLAIKGDKSTWPVSWRHWGILILAILSVTLLFPFVHHLETITRKYQWRGQELWALKDTKYGNLAIIARGNEFSVYENGLWMFTLPDPRSAEHAVHFPLLLHHGPKNVLLIGGGLSGTIEEVLKYPSVQKVDYLELDPDMVHFLLSWLPDHHTTVLGDKRVNLVFGDARVHVLKAKNFYDAILVNLPPPKTIQLNRYYTLEFLEDTKKALRMNGVISISLKGSESSISPVLAQGLKVLLITMEKVFDRVILIPGETVRFMGIKGEGPVDITPEGLGQKIRDLGIPLKYIQDYFLYAQLSPQRKAYLKGLLGEISGAKVNSDLFPNLYLQELINWAKVEAPGIGALLARLGSKDLGLTMGLGLLMAALLAVAIVRHQRHKAMGLTLGLSTAIMGFTQMAIGVFILILYQSFYGSLYFRLTFLVSFHMLGMALGSLWVTKRLALGEGAKGFLYATIGEMAFFCLGLMALTLVLPKIGPQIKQHWEWEAAFLVLPLIAGVLGGAQFSLAGLVYQKKEGQVGKAGGLLYGLDILGASMGALFTGVVLLPHLGLPFLVGFLGVLNLVSLFLTWIGIGR